MRVCPGQKALLKLPDKGVVSGLGHESSSQGSRERELVNEGPERSFWRQRDGAVIKLALAPGVRG